jgi:hypothetical protein
MKFTWIASSGDIRWYEFKVGRSRQQFALEVGQVIGIGQSLWEILVVEYGRSGMSGTLIVQSV